MPKQSEVAKMAMEMSKLGLKIMFEFGHFRRMSHGQKMSDDHESHIHTS